MRENPTSVAVLEALRHARAGHLSPSSSALVPMDTTTLQRAAAIVEVAAIALELRPEREAKESAVELFVAAYLLHGAAYRRELAAVQYIAAPSAFFAAHTRERRAHIHCSRLWKMIRERKGWTA